MAGLHDLPGDLPIWGHFPGHATAGTDIEVPVFRAPYACKVTAVEWIPNANVTGDDTNNFTLKVWNRVAGAGTKNVASLAFATGVNGTALTPKTITLGAAADLILAAGDVITCAKIKLASGLACPPGAVIVHTVGY